MFCNETCTLIFSYANRRIQFLLSKKRLIMIKIFSNIFKVRFSFVSARVLFIFFLFFSFANQDLHAQCTAAAYQTYSASSGCHTGYYNNGCVVSYNGREYTAKNGPHYSIPPTDSYRWTDNGACVSCSVGSASSTPTVLQNTALTNITHATQDVTGVTSSTGLPSGVTAAYSSNVLTISGTPTATGTFNYTIDVAGCDDDATGTITVVDCTVGSASSTPTTLNNVAMTNITHATGGVTGVTSSTGLPSGVTAAYSSNVLTISGTPTVNGTFNYTIDLAGCGTDATGTIVVTTAPGGVTDHLRLWLKADAGTNTTTEDADVTEWADQSTLGFDADDSYSGHNGPDYKANGINFNPALDFSGSNEGLRLTGAFIEVARDAYFFYLVSQRDDADDINRTVFRVKGNSSPNKYLWFRHRGTESSGAHFCYGKAVNGEGIIKGTVDNATIQPYLWSFGAHASSSSTPNGTRRYIQQNNTTIVDNNASSNVRANNASNLMMLGSNENGAEDYDGLIAEIICLDDIPTDEEDVKIKSYLALKYGISLGATTDLKNSAGTVIWDKDYGDGTYTNDISGIGRDDASGFNQKQSKSINSDDIMTISTQAIAATNAANTTQLSNNVSFEMWANNNGSVAVQQTEKPASFSHRLTREWLVQETGTVGGVTIEFDLTGLTFANTDATKFGLVIDDDGDFSGGTQTTEKATSFTSNKLTFNSVDLTNGKYITVMNGATVLPVDLRYFEGKRIGSNVLLEWETMAEINNDYFIVEKSTDGTNWDELLTVNGQGNTSEQTYYSQIDIDGCNGTCYYRLTQVDFDGNSEKFKVVAVSVNEAYNKLEISVSPNPINQTANIAFTAPESGMFSLTVTTQTGQVMYTANTMGDKGNNHISYNAAMLSSGSYYFILEDENGNRTQQLVIK